MTIILDGNSLGYASQANKPLSHNGVDTTALYHFLKSLKNLKDTHREYQRLLVLWDGQPTFRKELYPDYKGNRNDNKSLKEIREAYKSSRPNIIEALTLLGVTQIIPKNYEADDLAGFFVRSAKKKGKNVLLVTGDADWKQLVNEHCVWFDQRKRSTCTLENFEEATGVKTPAQFLQCKAIQGDKSDNIDGIMGIGDKSAKAIMTEYGSVTELINVYRKNGEFTKENLPKSLGRFRTHLNRFCESEVKIFTRNYRLMNLLTDKRDDDMRKDVTIVKKPKDIKAFADFCSELGMTSIVRDAKYWDQTFS